MLRLTLAVLFTSALAASPAVADNLIITEIWAGGLDGNEYTADWFELTNFGPTAETVSGLYYDDDSADPSKDFPLMGISSIDPGESVIFVVDADSAITNFVNMWGSPNGDLSSVQVGYVDGSGLGTDSDAVNIFDGNTAAANMIDSAAYTGPTQLESYTSTSNGTWIPTLSVNGVLGAYAGNFPATDALGMAAPIGSPGTVVPEPSLGIMIFSLLFTAVIAPRRRGR